ncbi:hypothetical protein EG329_009967 [Mollisiaceae sp. DMI_Dod_QoI]|nr:hypothetical protein EG329_009967 [Helotiales sp. DMI_Dod_QoI]
MSYFMEIHVDGGCRGNGYPGSIGAAAAVFKYSGGEHQAWTRVLPSNPTPTNQRAELTAIILALEQALQLYSNLNFSSTLDVKIFSDSRYAVGCMTQWIQNWRANGWRNANGQDVANRDLIEEANALNARLQGLGNVSYQWLPREQNQDADRYCNQAMDGEEDRRMREQQYGYEYQASRW